MNNMREILSRLERYDKVVVYWKDDIVKICIVAEWEDTNMVIYNSKAIDNEDILELELDESLVVPCPTVVTDEFMRRIYFALGERKEKAYVLESKLCHYYYRTMDELWEDFKTVFESANITKDQIIAELIDNYYYEIKEGLTIYKDEAYPSEFEVLDDRE